MNNKEIAVSIICNTFNHGLYIKKALDGFVNQIFTEEFEVLVHDDASTDDTRSIIQQYAELYPTLIKPFYQEENQYSKGNGIIHEIQYGRAKGKYIAFCEGDDYWTDKYKLQKQFDAMEANKGIDLCVHSVYLENNGNIIGKLKPSLKTRVLGVKEMIINGGGFVGSCSLFYRSSLNEEIPRYRKTYMYDYAIQLQGSTRGGALFLSDTMGVYRIASIGSWTERVYNVNSKRIQHNDNMINMLEMFNDFTKNNYDIYVKYMMDWYRFDSELHRVSGDIINCGIALLQLKYLKVYLCYGPLKSIKKVIKIFYLILKNLKNKHT